MLPCIAHLIIALSNPNANIFTAVQGQSQVHSIGVFCYWNTYVQNELRD